MHPRCAIPFHTAPRRIAFQPPPGVVRLCDDRSQGRGTGVEIEGFAQFVAVRYAELARTAYLLTGSTYAAEDLVQSCLLKVMSRWEDVDDPMAYLRRAMVNQR